MHTGGEGGQDFELNLAPIIDCFTVLITYLLVSASFISLAVLDVGVAANGVAATPGVPPLSLMVDLKAAKEIEVKLKGGQQNLDLTYLVPIADGTWNRRELKGRIDQIKKKYPALDDVSLSAERVVPYKEIVLTVELLRKDFPKIYLGG